jgi:flagellar P-ring protein precursor FlgI
MVAAVSRRARLLLGCLLALAGLLGAATAQAERVKDLASIAGLRSNQLVGYGLVVGLDGTGDQTSQTPFTVQSIINMLQNFGITVPSNVNPQLKNVAAVMVTASLQPFAKPGQHMDITVSSIGNAKSLRGGTLLMTPLRGANGQVYAMAQGNLVVGGYGAQGASGSSTQVNTLTDGLIPGGATVERSVPTAFDQGDSITLNLQSPDFTTAARLTQAINQTFGAGTAQAVDAASVQVRVPQAASDRVDFVSALESLEVEPGAAPARVVVNARTGTVIIGSDVRVLPAAVAHGNLTVTISEQPQVSQPLPFSRGGQTAVVSRSDVKAKQEKAHAFVFRPGVSLDSIVQAINRVGATPDDLVAILEALKKAGALRARLVVI